MSWDLPRGLTTEAENTVGALYGAVSSRSMASHSAGRRWARNFWCSW